MKVLTLFPPNYTAINRAFGVRGKPVIFAYRDIIYNPSRIKVTPALMAHEAVHCGQQGTDPDAWWASYICDSEFRLREELEAHRAEYQFESAHREGKAKAHVLHLIAFRLASPIYGGMIDLDEAKRRIAA